MSSWQPLPLNVEARCEQTAAAQNLGGHDTPQYCLHFTECKNHVRSLLSLKIPVEILML